MALTKKTSKIKGGRLGTIQAVKRTLKKSGNSFVKTVPVDDSINVRFVEEPSDWYGYYEHYDKGNKSYFPCTEDGCTGCANATKDDRRSFRYLANVYSLDDSKVVPLKMTKDLANQIIARYEKYKTILDRDYELSRTGSGMNDTVYMASPEPPTKMNLSRFKPLDLDEVLASMLEQWEENEADDDDDDDRPAKKSSRSAKEKDPWHDDDDEEDDEDDDEPRSTKKKTIAKKPVSKTASKSIKRTVRR